MTVTLNVYETDGTLRGSLTCASAEWSDIAREDGNGACTVIGSTSAAKLGEMTVVRVNDGTADRFAFVPTSKLRRKVKADTEVDLEGPGVRWLLTAGEVRQEDTSDCALPEDVRWFGWMAGAYDDSAWTAPSSHGQWKDQPFDTPRPEGFPVRHAEYLWRTTSYDLGEEDVLFRQTFTVSTEGDYVLVIAADDEYECWLDGTKLPVGGYGSDQLYQWTDYDEFPVKLCAGAHTFAVRGRNLPANVAGQNPGWVIWAFAEAAADGHPAAQNDIHEIYTTATGGTWTLRVMTSDTTSTLDYNASASEVQTAIETQIGAGNVTVSGSGTSGDPWTIEMIGERANTFTVMQADGTNLTGGTLTKDHTQYGSGAKTVAYSNTTDVVHYDPSGGEPGMTPGHILKVAMDEARARGTTVLDDVTDGYSATLDSNGNAWTFELNMPVALPATVHRIAVMLEEQGVDVWMEPDLTLECAEERGQDDPIVTTFTVGTHEFEQVEAVQEESTIRNVLRTRVGTGWGESTDATSVTTRGRWEAAQVLDGWDTASSASAHVTLLLNDLSRPQRITTLRFTSESNGPQPFTGFNIGDRVSGPAFGTSGWDQTDMRVVSIGGIVDEDDIVWVAELVD